MDSILPVLLESVADLCKGLVIKSSGRSLQISKDELLGQNYGKRNDLHLIFNIWYKEIEFDPSYSGNELQIDHIFPTKLLKEVKIDGDLCINQSRDKNFLTFR